VQQKFGVYGGRPSLWSNKEGSGRKGWETPGGSADSTKPPAAPGDILRAPSMIDSLEVQVIYPA
jgi:hypothetical protein